MFCVPSDLSSHGFTTSPVAKHCQSWPLHDLTSVLAGRRLTRVLAGLHLLNEELEGLLDVLVVPRTGFRPAALELLRELLAVFGRDLALLGTKIRLVSNDDNGYPVDSEVVEDLVTNNTRHLETLLACDGVDDHIAMDANEVLRVKNAILILPCSVNDLSREVLILPLDHLAESVLDGRVVAVDKVTVDELHRHTRLADSSTANDGHLSLLGRGGHFAGNYVVYVCIYKRVERFDGVVFALSVNCCWKAGAQARCEVDPGS